MILLAHADRVVCKDLLVNHRIQLSPPPHSLRRPRVFDHLALVRVSWSCGQTFLAITLVKFFDHWQSRANSRVTWS